MKISDFLNEMQPEWFPCEEGEWITLDQHDPQFTKTELKSMEKAGIIELDTENQRYRLTMKATRLNLVKTRTGNLV